VDLPQPWAIQEQLGLLPFALMLCNRLMQEQPLWL